MALAACADALMAQQCSSYRADLRQWKRLAVLQTLTPFLLVITGVTLLALWRSIIDPWGWYLEGANALGFASFVIFAGALVLMGFREFDLYSLDARRSAG
jgi:hypothetical protein